ncbi:DUF7003 family protein [Bacillus thuringiensis]|uniref:DUF7003 family protein n=2 Tax=Bacillus TaxID=1386 RepID=UPI00211D253E|nr:hypothetical protein [Bacillus thuringiensis]
MLYYFYKQLVESDYMKAKEILKLLDGCAEDFDFPVLDNYNFDLAQCRLSVFRNTDQWLIVFEIVGVDAGQDIGNNIFIYGNTVNQNGLIKNVDEIVSLANEEWWYDDEGYCIIDPFQLELLINGEPVTLNPLLEEYTLLGIKTESFNPTNLIRYLNSKYKEKFWLETQELLDEIDIDIKPTLFYQTEEWEHPDISDEQKPSQSIFFQSLAQAIELNDVGLIKSSTLNTHWSNWTWSDFENQEED